MTARRLPPGALHLGAALQSMARRSDGTYELRFSDSAKPVIADFVILATPWTTLRDVDLEAAGLSRYRLTAIESLGMGTDVKLLVQYTKRPWKFRVAGGGGIWSGGMEHTDPNFETWESSTDEPGSSGLITVFAGGSGSMVFANSEPHVVAPEPIVTRIIGDIDDVVPGSRQHYNGTAWLDYWTGDEWTRGSYAAYTPDQMTKYWGYAGIPEGHVHFAGEHTSTYSQGFLNGGVESASGRRSRSCDGSASTCRGRSPRCLIPGSPAIPSSVGADPPQPGSVPSSSSIVARDGGRIRRRRAAVRSASLITRSTFPPAIAESSASV